MLELGRLSEEELGERPLGRWIERRWDEGRYRDDHSLQSEDDMEDG